MVAIKHEQTIDQRWWFDQQMYIHTIYVYYIWILYMLDIIYSMVYSNIQIYICIHIYICWIEPKWIARWLWIYSNQHDHDFFKQTHTGYLFGISVKGSHPLEFIQHKKQKNETFCSDVECTQTKKGRTKTLSNTARMAIIFLLPVHENDEAPSKNCPIYNYYIMLFYFVYNIF